MQVLEAPVVFVLAGSVVFEIASMLLCWWVWKDIMGGGPGAPRDGRSPLWHEVLWLHVLKFHFRRFKHHAVVGAEKNILQFTYCTSILYRTAHLQTP